MVHMVECLSGKLEALSSSFSARKEGRKRGTEGGRERGREGKEREGKRKIIIRDSNLSISSTTISLPQGFISEEMGSIASWLIIINYISTWHRETYYNK
jgi:hypothetical protein